jgi:hypothetical protein
MLWRAVYKVVSMNSNGNNCHSFAPNMAEGAFYSRRAPFPSPGKPLKRFQKRQQHTTQLKLGVNERTSRKMSRNQFGGCGVSFFTSFFPLRGSEGRGCGGSGGVMVEAVS